MVLNGLSALLTDYLDSTLQGALGSLETGIRRLLVGAAVFLSGVALVLFGAFMVLGGLFLYLGQKPQFLVPAVCTATMSVLAGLLLLKTGSCMSRLTQGRKRH